MNLETLNVTAVDLYLIAEHVVVGAALFLKRFVEYALHQQQMLAALEHEWRSLYTVYTWRLNGMQ